MMSSAVSCDTFVVLPPLTKKNDVIFGKNSDRPQNEVQELVYLQRTKKASQRIKCTYIEVDAVEETNAVVLSKPAWMWGAEMGANEFGVVIGNEAVWTKIDDCDARRLLGMDLLRLALERGKSSRECLDVITSLLEKYGQGGPCSDTLPDFTYNNSFLIVDNHEAWVLETIGKFWAAERVESGFRNISNCLSISTKIDLMSEGLKEEAVKRGLWAGNGQFHFANIFGSKGEIEVCGRYQAGVSLMKKLSEGNQFDVISMIKILRDKESDICRGVDDSFPTQGSQVSVLSAPNSNRPHCHWFTCTPDPSNSAFKPFIFVKNVKPCLKTCSPKVEGTNSSCVDMKHVLYTKHEQFYKKSSEDDKDKMRQTLRDMESTCIKEVEETLENFDPNDESLQLSELFNDTVEAELRFYK